MCKTPETLHFLIRGGLLRPLALRSQECLSDLEGKGLRTWQAATVAVRGSTRRWLLHVRSLSRAGIPSSQQTQSFDVPAGAERRGGGFSPAERARRRGGEGSARCVRYALWMGRDGTLVQLMPKHPRRRGLPFRRGETALPTRPLLATLLAGVSLALLLLSMPLLISFLPEGVTDSPAVVLLVLLLDSPLLVAPVVGACLIERRLESPELRQARRFHQRLGNSRVRYEGGDGSRPEQAVIIRGALHPLIAKAGALWVVMGACRRRGLDWQMVSFDRLTLGQRIVDQYVIRLSSGVERALYFDITESFGGGP
jgi:hypothetical protein